MRTTVVMPRPRRGEDGGAQQDDQGELKGAVGPVGIQHVDAEEQLRHDLEPDHDDRGADHGGQVGSRESGFRARA